MSAGESTTSTRNLRQRANRPDISQANMRHGSVVSSSSTLSSLSDGDESGADGDMKTSYREKKAKDDDQDYYHEGDAFDEDDEFLAGIYGSKRKKAKPKGNKRIKQASRQPVVAQRNENGAVMSTEQAESSALSCDLGGDVQGQAPAFSEESTVESSTQTRSLVMRVPMTGSHGRRGANAQNIPASPILSSSASAMSTESSLEQSNWALPTGGTLDVAPRSRLDLISPFPSTFVAPATPRLELLFAQVNDVLHQARIEATQDESLQTECHAAIEGAIASLETYSQQLAICLIMNRYAAFCTSAAVNMPVFPITSRKLALLLSRVLDTPLGAAMRHSFPQPPCAALTTSDAAQPTVEDDPTTSAAMLALPVANGIDRKKVQLGPGEGDRVSAELVRCWIDAMNFAQSATRPCWIRLLHNDAASQGGRQGVFTPNTLRPLTECPLLGEIVNAVESLLNMVPIPENMLLPRSGLPTIGTSRADGRSKGKGGQEPEKVASVSATVESQKKTSATAARRWVKGGKVVAGPRRISAAAGTDTAIAILRDDPSAMVSKRLDPAPVRQIVDALPNCEHGSTDLERPIMTLPSMASEHQRSTLPATVTEARTIDAHLSGATNEALNINRKNDDAFESSQQCSGSRESRFDSETSSPSTTRARQSLHSGWVSPSAPSSRKRCLQGSPPSPVASPVPLPPIIRRGALLICEDRHLILAELERSEGVWSQALLMQDEMAFSKDIGKRKRSSQLKKRGKGNTTNASNAAVSCSRVVQFCESTVAKWFEELIGEKNTKGVNVLVQGLNQGSDTTREDDATAVKTTLPADGRPDADHSPLDRAGSNQYTSGEKVRQSPSPENVGLEEARTKTAEMDSKSPPEIFYQESDSRLDDLVKGYLVESSCQDTPMSIAPSTSHVRSNVQVSHVLGSTGEGGPQGRANSTDYNITDDILSAPMFSDRKTLAQAPADNAKAGVSASSSTMRSVTVDPSRRSRPPVVPHPSFSMSFGRESWSREYQQLQWGGLANQARSVTQNPRDHVTHGILSRLPPCQPISAPQRVLPGPQGPDAFAALHSMMENQRYPDPRQTGISSALDSDTYRAPQRQPPQQQHLQQYQHERQAPMSPRVSPPLHPARRDQSQPGSFPTVPPGGSSSAVPYNPYPTPDRQWSARFESTSLSSGPEHQYQAPYIPGRVPLFDPYTGKRLANTNVAECVAGSNTPSASRVDPDPTWHADDAELLGLGLEVGFELESFGNGFGVTSTGQQGEQGGISGPGALNELSDQQW